MKVRMICTKHHEVLENVGNGDIVYPTIGPYKVEEGGWLTLDMSEYTCPYLSDEATESELECLNDWAWEVRAT